MSQLETAMGMTIAVFDKYAKADGNRQTLTKAELKTLLEQELPNFLSVREGRSIVSVEKVQGLPADTDFSTLWGKLHPEIRNGS